MLRASQFATPEELAGSKFIGMADIDDDGEDLTVKTVTEESLPNSGRTLCLSFSERPGTLAANKGVVSELYNKIGDECATWIGRRVHLSKTTTRAGLPCKSLKVLDQITMADATA